VSLGLVGSTYGDALIYVGMVLGGPESLPPDLAAALADVQDRITQIDTGPGSLDLVFVIGGSLRDADFDGVRVGRLSRSRKIVQVQAAIPLKAVRSELAPRMVNLLTRRAIGQGGQALAAAGLRFESRLAVTALGGLLEEGPTAERVALSPVVEVHFPTSDQGGRSLSDDFEAALFSAVNQELGAVVGHEAGADEIVYFFQGKDHGQLVRRLLTKLGQLDVQPRTYVVNRDPGQDLDERLEVPPNK
jgi:hypothetical protein